jgi:hypothetical protein
MITINIILTVSVPKMAISVLFTARNGLFLEINVPFLEILLELLEILEISSRRDAPYSRIPGQTVQL